MEKETKRILQRMLDTMQEQQRTIRLLEGSTQPSTQKLRDEVADRIDRMVQEVSKLKSFSLEWEALADRGLAARHSGPDDPAT